MEEGTAIFKLKQLNEDMAGKIVSWSILICAVSTGAGLVIAVLAYTVTESILAVLLIIFCGTAAVAMLVAACSYIMTKDISGKAKIFKEKEIIEKMILERNIALKKADTDPMTGLLNKSVLVERMDKELAVPQGRYSVIMLDMDDFKVINDSRGHIAGDSVLLQVATALQRVFSADDLIGRFGGDEFVVFMNGLTKEQTELKIERLMQEISTADSGMYTCSIGVYTGDDRKQKALDIISRADAAMYTIKENGKNSYCIFEENAGLQTAVRS